MTRLAITAIFASFAVGIAVAGCGTLGPIASPTPIVFEPTPTPTPTLADRAKSAIAERFEAQIAALNAGDIAAAYQMCAPDYRAQNDVGLYSQAITDYLARFNVTPTSVDARNLVVKKGTAERYDITYDIFINGEFSETIANAGGYLMHNGTWFDDHALCR